MNDLHLERDPVCAADSLKFATDRNFNQTFATLCNTASTGQVYTSKGHLLFVKFEADHDINGMGFDLSYQKVKSSCGGIYKGGSAIISTPNYPKTNYENNITCEWDIKTDISHSITLNILEFDIEESPGCAKDKLEIIDIIFNKTLWSGCGRKSNQTSFTTQRNELLVRLKTDETVNAKGFKAEYTQSCGSSIIATDSGVINFRRTTSEKNCVWRIISEDLTKKVSLTFTHSNLKENIRCSAEVKVIEGDGIDGPVRKSFCDSKVPPTIVSNGNALTIVATTKEDEDIQFDAVYSVLDKCKSLLKFHFITSKSLQTFYHSYSMRS